MKFTREQHKLIFKAVSNYKQNKCIMNGKEYNECANVLKELYDIEYDLDQGEELNIPH
jgi:hemerythrin